MAVSFRLVSTPPFERSLKRLAKKNRAITSVVEDMFSVLGVDPLNVSRRYNIKKLTGIEQGSGQWRIRSGVYRLRYDVIGEDVVLYSINHRKDIY
jgi:mRNA-degrading endonuclease RelE of RelBE toxin-antitoxin system